MDKYIYIKPLQDVIDKFVSDDSKKYYSHVVKDLHVLIIGNIYDIKIQNKSDNNSKFYYNSEYYEIYEGVKNLGFVTSNFFDCFISFAKWRQNRLEEVLND